MKTMLDEESDDGGSMSFTMVLSGWLDWSAMSSPPDMNSSAVRERSHRDRIGEAASLLD
jgi:hypothetical protein